MSSEHYTINGKEVNLQSLEVAGVDMTDYPDFCDAFFECGLFVNGTEMTSEELAQFEQRFADTLSEKVSDYVISRADYFADSYRE